MTARFFRLCYSVYKCTAILHVTMERAHRESSMLKLDYDAKRVAIIYGITHVLLGWFYGTCVVRMVVMVCVVRTVVMVHVCTNATYWILNKG